MAAPDLIKEMKSHFIFEWIGFRGIITLNEILARDGMRKKYSENDKYINDYEA